MSNYNELTLYQLNEGFSESMRDPSLVDSVSCHVYEHIMQEILLDIIFEFHYGIKTGNYKFRQDDVCHNESELLIVNEPGLDIFGERALKKDQYCICPSCSTKVCSVKFAKHLQECMGLVIRKSSRLAQRGGTTNSTSSYSGNGDNYDGYDSDCAERGKKKISLRNSSTKKTKNGRSNKSSARHAASEVSQFSNLGEYVLAVKEETLEYMTTEERRNMLRRICGVVSEHTKKLCTRTPQCPQHTAEQKRAVREALIDQYNEYLDLNEGDDSRSVSVSPADSGSNSNSGSIQGRKKEKPQRGRPPKTRRSSPNNSPMN